MLRSLKYRSVQRSLHTSRTCFSKIVNSKSGKFIDENSKYSVTTYSRPSVVFEKGEKAYLWDVEGRKYVDFTAGIAVTALGHSNPEISKILYDQSTKLVHSSNLYHNLWTNRLSRELVEATKQSGGMHDASRVFLANSGTEANEAALKFARKYGKSQNENKTEFITFTNSFHGRSMGALSVTPNPKYQKPFSPLIPGVSVSEPNLESFSKLINENTAGVIIEPIQGEGGVRPVSKEFLIELKKLTKKHNALLIFDEIQCGLGRSGNLWAHGSLPKEAHPDIVTMAKALGNGFPIGATMITENVEKALNVGDHGTTYGGNPLGARVGSYVLSQVSEKEFLNKVSEKSQIFRNELESLKNEINEIVEVRGEGLLLGVQFKSDPSKVVDAARERGLLVITAGGNTVRFVPALNIEDDVIREGLAIFKDAVKSVFP
ncbi:Glutamate-1-semialdehyde 2,1-aminomutase [Wickerhamomyces ciferrii]|uniref:Acetylornithine aminotransferase, mitochondrial n=1 Tax=Wickerhamomyces ciferrii (strain ATCC 14091 / BCRC 22168 / CBS 111 / JCM 3599 / NBRC 0793 / NRRL Y-1031 F-60-10) TaxID=1206466 RepID=K0KKG3_WICCF|nr:Glutamate-1-semialdehyde 2,1-aminomutase [Wickerhamomyces ciferrii]CCH43456.1 Glutamate-1-semialdehyde 2,1-aminomutase [Wickerhamomyces ciferrii]